MNRERQDAFKRVFRKLTEAKSIVLTTHLNHDGDGVGSMLALFHVLAAYGKPVRMLLNEKISEQFRCLEGTDLIENCTGQTLTCDLLIIIDTDESTPERLGIKGTLINYADCVCVDHHSSNNFSSQLCLLDTSAAATGELLFDLFAFAQIQINKKIADCLYMAISTDCGSFRYSNTTGKTMRVAAVLLDKGVRPELINRSLSVKSFKNTKALANVLGTLEEHAAGIVSATINNALYQALDKDTDNYVDYARRIAGCTAAVLFKEVEPDVVKVSLRFVTADAARFASYYGGGGHLRAAGFQIAGKLPTVKAKIIEELRDYLLQADGECN